MARNCGQLGQQLESNCEAIGAGPGEKSGKETGDETEEDTGEGTMIMKGTREGTGKEYWMKLG